MTQLDRISRWVLDSETTALRRWAEEHQARRGRVAVKRAPRLRAERASKEDAAESRRLLRAVVFERAEGACEMCGVHPPQEWHHLASGPNRRLMERASTTLAVCVTCHRWYHQGKVFAFAMAYSAALENGADPEVLAQLQRRIDKATR